MFFSKLALFSAVASAYTVHVYNSTVLGYATTVTSVYSTTLTTLCDTNGTSVYVNTTVPETTTLEMTETVKSTKVSETTLATSTGSFDYYGSANSTSPESDTLLVSTFAANTSANGTVEPYSGLAGGLERPAVALVLGLGAVAALL